MDVHRARLIEAFIAEAGEQLETLDQSLVQLETASGDADLLALVFRAAHSLKGNALITGLSGIGELAHLVEDVLDKIRHGVLPVDSGVVTKLLDAVDALRTLVGNIVDGVEHVAPEQAAVVRRLEPLLVVEEPEAAPDSLAPPPDSRPLSADATATPVVARTQRVDSERLDRMLLLTGEIGIARGRLRRALEVLGPSARTALDAYSEMDRLGRDLQDELMMARMVPIGPVLRQYVRVARDTAETVGKKARVVIGGDDAEIDATVVDYVRGALTHLLRNAVDHGLESPGDRVTAGKDPVGTIVLAARRDAGTIAIEVRDDGRGLDFERIRARAETGGLAGIDELSQEKLEEMILRPGFSTAERVTGLSGRGVGLDAVKRGVEALRGSLDLVSVPGQGTTVTLRFPLTLAIIDGFYVAVGDDSYVIPLSAVTECLELPRERLRHEDGCGVLNLRGAAVPYLRLRELFAIPGAPPSRESVVVIRVDGTHAGIVVDRLVGQGQVVIKPLGAMFHRVVCVSGSTIDDDGRVALILDVPRVLSEVVGRARTALGDGPRPSA